MNLTIPARDARGPALISHTFVHRQSTMNDVVTVQLSDDVAMRLILVPAGRVAGQDFPPRPLDLSPLGGLLLLLGVGIWVVVIAREIRRHRRPVFTLRSLMILTFGAAIIVMGAMTRLKSNARLREFNASVLPFDDYRGTVLAENIYVGECEVSQAQFKAVMGYYPSRRQNDKMPVVSLRWDEASAFCDAVRSRTGTPVRLLNSNEWAYCCRAGSITSSATSRSPKHVRTTCEVVGNSAADDLRLFDIVDNVREWCADPQPWGHLARGASYRDNPKERNWRILGYVYQEDYTSDDMGFRIAVKASDVPHENEP